MYKTPPNSQSPAKRRYSSSSSSSGKKKRTRRKLRTKRKRPYGRIRWNRMKRRAVYSGSRVINVAADKEFATKSYQKQKVTRKQQKIINRRFKEGSSPFIDRVISTLQLVKPGHPDQCKWIWRCGNGLDLIRKAFAAFPSDASVTGSSPAIATSLYIKSQEQSIYFGQFKYEYEISNPTNYDMNLVIYDIVYKQDTDDNVSSKFIESPSLDVGIGDNNDTPLALMARGTDNITAYPEPGSSGQSIVVADPTSFSYTGLGNTDTKPTDFYPFNIYCKIVKKHTYRLQPGASMKHVFVHKPKALFNLGYFYKYKKYFKTSASGSADVNVGIKDITSGCLFKVWGQILNSGSTADADRPQVTTGSARIAIRETLESKWYAMDNKFSFISTVDNSWKPASADEAKLEVINDVKPNVINDVDMDSTNNS